MSPVGGKTKPDITPLTSSSTKPASKSSSLPICSPLTNTEAVREPLNSKLGGLIIHVNGSESHSISS